MKRRRRLISLSYSTEKNDEPEEEEEVEATLQQSTTSENLVVDVDSNDSRSSSLPRRSSIPKAERVVDRSLWLRIGDIRFNPTVTFASIIFVWLFVAWCIVSPEGAQVRISATRDWISHHFTWMYVAIMNGWILFWIWVYFSKYSSIKLGRDDEEPEFNDASWFMMFFSCGVSIGLFFYSVSEPMAHYTQVFILKYHSQPCMVCE